MKIELNIVSDSLQTLLNLSSNLKIDVIKVEPNDKGNLTIVLIVDTHQALVKLSEFYFG